MSQRRVVVRNVATAFFAQAVAMLVSVIVTLIVPRQLGVKEYGYWQLFIFYTSYVGLFHLGLNDGVYLLNGGRKRSEIDPRDLNAQMLIGIIFQSIIGVMIIAYALTCIADSDRKFIVSLVAPFLVVKNTTLFLGYLFQALDETRTWSYSCVLERLFYLLSVVLLLMFHVTEFHLYILGYFLATIAQFAYCLWHGRWILSAGPAAISSSIRSVGNSIRVGMKLMVANAASLLVLGITRAVVDAVWGIETFGQLSLSLSMVNFFLSFVTQAAMVLFPALRKAGTGKLEEFYKMSRKIMSVFMPFIYIMYYPLSMLLSKWLPQYSGSLEYLPYLLPICVFESKMSVCCATYFKVARQENKLLTVNVASAVLAGLGSLIAAYIFKSTLMVILVATSAIVLRSCWSEYRISKDLGEEMSRCSSCSDLIMGVAFVSSATMLPVVSALTLCLIIYVFMLLFNMGYLKNSIREISK